jgi:signal transduction histidine kinase
VTIGASVPETIAIDRRCLRHTLTNLISNALKFTKSGRIDIGVTMNDSHAGVAHLSLEVRDTGIGILPEDAERIFDPFTQLDDRLCRSHGGSGLGLAICRRLCEMMGGSIRAWPNQPKGTVFAFCVPCSVAAEAPAIEDVEEHRL